MLIRHPKYWHRCSKAVMEVWLVAEWTLWKGLFNRESSPLCTTMEPDIAPLMETRLTRKATLQSECTLEIPSQSFILSCKASNGTARRWFWKLLDFIPHYRHWLEKWTGWGSRFLRLGGSTAKKPLPLSRANCNLMEDVVQGPLFPTLPVAAFCLSLWRSLHTGQQAKWHKWTTQKHYNQQMFPVHT